MVHLRYLCAKTLVTSVVKKLFELQVFEKCTNELQLMFFFIMLHQRIAAKIVFQIPDYRMNMVGVSL